MERERERERERDGYFLCQYKWLFSRHERIANLEGEDNRKLFGEWA